ncbi:MAG: glycosyltransferase [Burkholderia sp.]|jgi:glycosyltransferase involved in cell wall biosynthesis|uniref:glycosyltransferase n=1 Tax=Burkholderia sp. TaxID=36773 RepID=UPI0028306C20|nr:glycosyltransferase [Burkholderia sp.]MDR0241792.1 glycosyltransferase [Burkholderia sp.]
MRIVVDMQGAQSLNSRNRGVGRYTVSIVKAMIRNRGDHEIVLALNGAFEESARVLRDEFQALLPQRDIHVWHAAGPVAHVDKANLWRRQSGELTYEAFLTSLRPDFIYIASYFEGFGDDSITSIHALQTSVPVAVTLYDLIPYIHAKPYLENPLFKDWYLTKIEHLQRADLWLAISESSRSEGIEYLGLSPEWSVNMSADVDAWFRPVQIAPGSEAALREKYGLAKSFVLYTGGIDHRKNVEGLIRAFASLPPELRKSYQLAIVCSIQPASRDTLMHLARKVGLGPDDVVCTGFVPDEDLLALYNLCRLFVFPSWHEGFGLPVLEAMRCGAPVIGSNTSSVPEVIGWDEAMFDPRSDESIARYMQRGLSDEGYRQALIERAASQVEKFSWDQSGRCALEAMERRLQAWLAERRAPDVQSRRPRLAYVSPLPPVRTGIADYSAELLPELARFYDIDVIVDPDDAEEMQAGNISVKTPAWLLKHAGSYDRVLYHFGNSSFHEYMFPLLESVPGVVVLHDFFLSGILAHMAIHGNRPDGWSRALYDAHGYVGLRARHQNEDIADAVWEYPCSLGVIQKALGLIVHSSGSLQLARHWYGGDTTDWTVIPLMRDANVASSGDEAREALGFGKNDCVVCAFGALGPSKLNHRLLRAWGSSSLARDPACHLIFVGENQPTEYGEELARSIRKMGKGARVRITGWTDAQTFRQYLAAADVGVQLRTLSRGETSAAVLDCMNYGKATIVNENGSMADLDRDAVWMLPDEFSDEELVDALETLRSDAERRRQMGARARDIIVEDHAPDVCAEQYRDAIERFYLRADANLSVLSRAIARRAGRASDDQLRAWALTAARNFVPRHNKRQLLVDISELVQVDARSGIQRVVRNLLKEWLDSPPDGFRVEPVYATTKDSYRYAREFTTRLMGFEDGWLEDEPIDYAAGDVFVGLDLQPRVVPAQREFYQSLRLQGVQVKFVVYDLLCVLLPQYFVPGAAEGFTGWLDVVVENDGALCISQAVATELSSWLAKHAPERAGSFEIDWFHLGADIEHFSTSSEIPRDGGKVLQHLSNCPTFLMVGTLEPRKGHTQVLDAFEQLWRENQNVNLVIVGRQGWMVDDLVGRLRAHPEQGRHLFWMENASDDYLEKIYEVSSCLIAASYGEGFGLPLIEAAQHGLAIIARDLPVFREVAGEHAFYFSAQEGHDLATEIKAWLELRAKQQEISSRGMPFLTWAQSARHLAKILTRNEAYS